MGELKEIRIVSEPAFEMNQISIDYTEKKVGQILCYFLQ